MDGAVGRFTSYIKNGMLAFGEGAPFGGLDPSNLGGMATLNMFPYQSFGCFSAAVASASASAASATAKADTKIMNTPHRTVHARRSKYPRW